jgi:hypothetical protein
MNSLETSWIRREIHCGHIMGVRRETADKFIVHNAVSRRKKIYTAQHDPRKYYCNFEQHLLRTGIHSTNMVSQRDSLHNMKSAEVFTLPNMVLKRALLKVKLN